MNAGSTRSTVESSFVSIGTKKITGQESQPQVCYVRAAQFGMESPAVRRTNMAEAPYKGKRVEVEILTDTYKIRGILFLPLADSVGYASRLSDFLNHPDKTFLALTDVHVETLPEPNLKWDAPFLALNKSVVTMVRAIKE